jgi:glucans biosynthesis protein
MKDDPLHPTQVPSQLRQIPRFGAKTRSGRPCRSPAVTGRRRCRMHGGAPGSGGPKGARNGNYKHGRYTAEAMVTRRWVREKIREVRALTKSLRSAPGSILQDLAICTTARSLPRSRPTSVPPG